MADLLSLSCFHKAPDAQRPSLAQKAPVLVIANNGPNARQIGAIVSGSIFRASVDEYGVCFPEAGRADELELLRD